MSENNIIEYPLREPGETRVIKRTYIEEICESHNPFQDALDAIDIAKAKPMTDALSTLNGHITDVVFESLTALTESQLRIADALLRIAVALEKEKP